SPDQGKNKMPAAMYKKIAIAKSWQKVDISICCTMAFVCFIFALILFLFYFKLSTIANDLLTSAAVSLVLSILYTLNGMLVTRQLQSGSVHFPKDNNKVGLELY